ncbi:hypothetical protein [Dactylosporangium darangshiense]|uniref:hypothetical protein n=1 Tax=Dactylosporangium darangshiense TaxID=579108 RepID=UPI0031EEA1FE
MGLTTVDDGDADAGGGDVVAGGAEVPVGAAGPVAGLVVRVGDGPRTVGTCAARCWVGEGSVRVAGGADGCWLGWSPSRGSVPDEGLSTSAV